MIATSLERRLDWAITGEAERRAWIEGLRPPAPTADVEPIIDAVRAGGDDALRDLTRRFDGAAIDDLWVSGAAFDEAERLVPPRLAAAIDASIGAVHRYHADQRDALRSRRVVRTLPGVTAWRRWVPLERVGAYVPGGRAPLASSVIMMAVPARLAGVDDLILATPPDRNGRVAPAILAAARRLGVERVLRVGGAQAIAALAYGTQSVPAVDRIVGAGSAWVTAAKRAVSTDVAIDLPAGPSECVILADGDADPELVALDLLAQAEHGPDSVAVLVTESAALVASVEERLGVVAAGLATGAAAVETLRAHGGVIVVTSVTDGIQVADAIAPEHLSIQAAGANGLAEQVRHAGAVFIGPWAAIAAGDYATGTNHVLPTGGAARAYGALSVESFGRWIEVQHVTPRGIRAVAETVAALADAEGLSAHGRSVTARAERASTPTKADDPVMLLRRPEPITPYPAEPSDEELAAEVGLPADRIVRMDMNTLGGSAWSEYGDLAYVRLRGALAEVIGVEPERIIPGAGADELIRLVTGMAVGAGDAVVIPTPTFAMFAVEARLVGARVIEVPRHRLDRRQTPAEIRAAAEENAARLVWLCSPNNPTGDAYSLDEVRALADGLSAIVVVDEVYLEFAEASAGAAPNALSAQQLLEDVPNIVVLRSLSKAYGIPAARVGYLVVAPELAQRFDASRLPLPVAGPSEELALATIGHPQETLWHEVIEERDRLADVIAELGCEVLASVANFVSFRPPDAAGLAAELHRRGIIVRHYASGPMAGWLRATARPAPDADRLRAALTELLR